MPLAEGKRIRSITVRQPQLRWPVPEVIGALCDEPVLALERRAKWLIWRLQSGNLLWHLGMSGSFRGWQDAPQPGPHDHVDVQIDGGHLIRYTDPRRFGAVLWTAGDPLTHVRLASLGPEPFDSIFDGDYLWRLARGRRTPVKQFIMDGCIVVGVGNIYACEALFEAGIHPARAAGRISAQRYRTLAGAIVRILRQAIEVGGTSLRDFTAGDGTPGYFGQSLQVYGRAAQACPTCRQPIRRTLIGQRSSFYCPRCQR